MVVVLRWTGIAVVLAVLVGCADSPGGEDPPSTGAPIQQSETVSEPTGDPPVEPTDPEQPQPPQPNRPAINNAKLPVGGSVDFDEQGLACAEAFWGSGSIPEGVTVTIVRLENTDPGVVAVDQSVCGSKGPACGPGVRLGSGPACVVGLRAVGSGQATIDVYGDVSCTSEQLCAEFQRQQLDGAESVLKPDTTGVVPPSGSPSEQPEESPSEPEPPSEQPGESPSEQPGASPGDG